MGSNMPKLSDILWDYLPDKQAMQGMGNDLLAALNRGGVAGVLGAPVDIANQLANLGRALYGYAGNKAGVLSADQMPKLEDKPIGGSEWIGQKMQDAGLINNNRNALAELLSGMVMPGAMLKGGVKANQAIDAAIANAQMPNTINTPGYKGQRGAIVWHGSPHNILPKPGGKYPEFDMSKIGTGEGAQAYGHGLYFAEDPSVARYYQNTVPSPALKRHVAMQDQYWDLPIPSGLSGVAMDKFSEMVRQLGKTPIAFVQHQLKRGYITKDVADELMAIGLDGAKPVYQSHLYKVDIPDEAIPRMLDWNKPLSQQAPEVSSSVMRYLEGAEPDLFKTWMANGAIEHAPAGSFVPRVGESGNAFADAMRNSGVSGIRYLDGGSRSAGQGTSNYVLFDDKLGRILENNGVPTGQTPWTPEEWAAYLSGGGK